MPTLVDPLNHQSLCPGAKYDQIEPCSDPSNGKSYPISSLLEYRNRPMRRECRRNDEQKDGLALEVYRENTLLQSRKS